MDSFYIYKHSGTLLSSVIMVWKLSFWFFVSFFDILLYCDISHFMGSALYNYIYHYGLWRGLSRSNAISTYSAHIVLNIIDKQQHNALACSTHSILLTIVVNEVTLSIICL